MFAQADLVLLHAPSVYDFRKLPILFGPISDLVPSTPIFEMYPIGFSSIAEHLERNGIRVRIVNLALRMLKDKNFDAEKLIAKLKPRAFGIDLHWLPHAHGSLEVAALCKKHHPEIPVIFGGYSSSYFHEELIRYPQVDFVLRGDSAEEPLRRLLVSLRERSPPAEIPNLTWKDRERKRSGEPADPCPDRPRRVSEQLPQSLPLGSAISGPALPDPHSRLVGIPDHRGHDLPRLHPQLRHLRRVAVCA